MVAGWSQPLRDRLWIGTFHALGREWGVPIPDAMTRTDSDFWEVQFPDLMANLPAGRSPRFDALMVDEAQDFAPTWWQPLLAGLNDPDGDHILVLSDSRQDVFERNGQLPGLVPLTLTRNMRNSKQIARVFMPLGGDRQELVGVDGPPARLLPCATDDAVTTADDAAVGLLEAGWKAADVALLTTFHRHPVQKELVDGDGVAEYWNTLWSGDDIFYGTVPGFKGLERPAVVLGVNGFRTPEIARQVLFVGLSRASDLLVVCGDPELLKEVGGEELARRLLAN